MANKILFIGDGYPVGSEAGSVLYQKIIKLFGLSNICYFGIGFKTKLKWPNEYKLMQKNISCLRIWPNNSITKYLKRLPFIEEAYYFILIPLISRKVMKFARNNNVTAVIAVFRADVLAIINKIVDQYRWPVLGFISDTVEAEYGDKPKIFKYKVKEYYKAIEYAKGIYVAGEAMENYIKSNFNKPTSVLRLGYENNIITKKYNLNTVKEIKVFFSGSVYAPLELESFVCALSAFAIKYHEYKVIFTIAATYKLKTVPEKVAIRELGWLAESELIKEMQDAQIGYIPYKFDKASANQMTYAFPNKTGFYLSTGLPIFFHGPEYSSMSYLFKKYLCGIHCSSIDVDAIVADLEKILFDRDYYNKCVLKASEAFNNDFSMNVLADNFSKLIENTNLLHS